jgi:hypothetical protein
MTNIYCVSDLYIKISVIEMGRFIEERYMKKLFPPEKKLHIKIFSYFCGN